MKKRSAEKWSAFRLSVVGQLLHAPSERGELAQRIRALAATLWTHPTSGEPVKFGFSTIERWYQKARRTADVFEALKRKTPRHAGTHPSIDAAIDEHFDFACCCCPCFICWTRRITVHKQSFPRLLSLSI